MDLTIITEIKKELKGMYPDYRFDISADFATDEYVFVIFKDGNRLSTLRIKAQTAMDEVWEMIIEWVRPLLRL